MNTNENHLTTIQTLLKQWVCYRFATRERAQTMTEYNFPHPMIDPRKIRDGFGGCLEDYGYTLSKKCYHAHGIGNNNQYAIFTEGDENGVCVGHLYICIDFAGNGFVCICIPEGGRIGDAFRVSYLGYTIEPAKGGRKQ